MESRELWTKEDERHLAAFERALAVEDLAAALFAIEGASVHDAALGQAQLDSWALGLGSGLRLVDPTSQALALSDLVVERLKLRAAPHGADGAMLSRVLSRRRGRPILLAAVTMEIARRAGLRADGIGLPAHFLVQIGGRAGPFLDPGSGLLLSPDKEEAIRELVESSHAAHLLEPVLVADVLARVLKHLLECHTLANDLVQVFRVVSFVCAVRPQLPVAPLQRAAIADRLGAYRVADGIYRDVAERFPGTMESAVAEQRLASSRSRRSRLV